MKMIGLCEAPPPPKKKKYLWGTDTSFLGTDTSFKKIMSKKNNYIPGTLARNEFSMARWGCRLIHQQLCWPLPFPTGLMIMSRGWSTAKPRLGMWMESSWRVVV